MSRKLLAFLLTELKTVRVICKECKTTTEVDIERLADVTDSTDTVHCHSCKKRFYQISKPGDNPFGKLADAIHALQSDAIKADVEFIIPDDSATAN